MVRLTALLRLVFAGSAAIVLISCGSRSAKDEATAVTATSEPVASSSASGSPAELGEKLFLQCRACHVVVPGQVSGIGPNLAGVIGRKAGALADYSYSPAMVKSGLIWTPETLDTFLVRPTELVPGTKMSYAGAAKPEQRAALIAYLGTLNPSRH